MNRRKIKQSCFTWNSNKMEKQIGEESSLVLGNPFVSSRVLYTRGSLCMGKRDENKDTR